MKCKKCGIEMAHHSAAFCNHPACSFARTAGMLPICTGRCGHGCTCLACTG